MDGLFTIWGGGKVSSEWTHVVLNYIGPHNGQGIRIYLDRVLTGSGTRKSVGHHSHGEGRVVVGREFTHLDYAYGSVSVDELLFYNQTLRDHQILVLKDML